MTRGNSSSIIVLKIGNDLEKMELFIVLLHIYKVVGFFERMEITFWMKEKINMEYQGYHEGTADDDKGDKKERGTWRRWKAKEEKR